MQTLWELENGPLELQSYFVAPLADPLSPKGPSSQPYLLSLKNDVFNLTSMPMMSR